MFEFYAGARRNSSRVVDPALVGDWNNGGNVPVRIDDQGWLYTIGEPTAYELSVDGTELTLTGANPLSVFSRVYGDLSALQGVWQHSFTDSGTVWIEELHFRADTTYTWHWLRDGFFDSELIGEYQDNGADFSLIERRASIYTGPADAIIISQLYGPTQEGSYAVDTATANWTFFGPGKDIVFVPFP